MKYKWPPFASSLVKAIVIYGTYMGVSAGLTFAIMGILKRFTFSEPILFVEITLFLPLLTIGIIVFIIDRQKWLKTMSKISPLKGINILSIPLLTLATWIFILGIHKMDDFIFNIPIETKPMDDNFSLGINIIIIMTMIVLAPVIEEVVFRKWIMGQFKNQGKQIYAGLIISSILFCFIHNLSSFLYHFIVGLILGLIYLRYGLKGSILFHAIYNLIWFVIRINRSVYDTWFTWLDFGFLYWSIVILSTVFVIFFILRSIKFINSNYTRAESGI